MSGCRTARLAAFLACMGVSLLAQASYRVEGTRILDDGEPVQLRGINWFGFETELHTVHGLWQRNWQEMIAQMAELGINAVRIPLCPATLRGRTPGGIDYDLNPDLQGLDSLQLLDRVMVELDARGMYVLLDHHRPDCEKISRLWYTDDYSETEWIEDLVFLARRYRDLPGFLGIDLKNEPHGPASWGTGNRETDWNAAAERAAAAVLNANPSVLVFVEGIESVSRACGDPPPPAWWGGNLAPQACAPLEIPDDRLVLSPHVYGPDVHPQPYFDAPDFPGNMPAIWDAHFGRFADDGFAIVPGEFGGRYGHAGDPRDRVWQDALVSYLREKGITSGFYWSWNPNSGDTGGLLRNDWTRVWSTKLALLQRLWHGRVLASTSAASGGVEAPTPREPPSQPAAPTRSATVDKDWHYTMRTISDWGDGYCVDVQVRNQGGRAGTWAFSVPVEGRIRNAWNVRHERTDGAVNVSGLDWNRTVAPGNETHFGFCARRRAETDNQAALVSLVDGGDLQVRIRMQSRWANGYCTDVELHNPGESAVDWRVSLTVTGRIHNLWRADHSQQIDRLIAEGKAYNNRIEPGASETFGFCADR